MKKLVLSIALITISVTAFAETPDWVQRSNLDAQPMLAVIARFMPERASQIGLEGHDEDIVDLRAGVYERKQAAYRAARVELEKHLANESDPAVRQDLQIMIDAATRNLESERLEHDLMLPYINVSQLVFGGIRVLLDPRVPKERQQLALGRLAAYAGTDGKHESIVRSARARIQERFKVAGLTGPYREQVEQNLGESPQMLQGLRELFKDSGLSGYEPALDALATQIAEYDDWVRHEILPRARADNRLPAALYVDNLRRVGITVSSGELVRRALLSFAETRNEMRALAPLVAHEKGYSFSDYPSVIRELKKQQFVGDAILPAYQKRLGTIEDIIRKQDIVSLPARDATIRLASPAEAALTPGPHMSPPRLIGNTGEFGDFILPFNLPGQGDPLLRLDDYTYDAASWTLIAHESRPGHELQFSSMIEKGVSLARAVFAYNSVNVEGWAVYAEAEMKPYFPLDGQLIDLQQRLQRTARAFLDPMVNEGKMSPQQARDFLTSEVAVSDALAKLEVDRFTYRSPGQGPAYFFGYQSLMEIRERAELALGAGFDRKRFHDFVLSQGLLPPDLLEKAVMEDFVPSQLAEKPS